MTHYDHADWNIFGLLRWMWWDGCIYFYIFSSEIPAPRCHVYAPPSHQYRELHHWYPTTSGVWASGNRKRLEANCVPPDSAEDCVSLFELLTAYCCHAGKKRLLIYQLLTCWIVWKTMKDVFTFHTISFQQKKTKFTMEHPYILHFLNCQYHACWCPGESGHQQAWYWPNELEYFAASTVKYGISNTIVLEIP